MSLPSYPWHEPVWHRLMAGLRQGRVPPAVLLSGPRGLGKGQLAHDFAAKLLCEARTACGTCAACRLLAADSHPDLCRIAPEPGKPLTIDRIRQLSGQLTLTPQYGRGRLVIVEAAERMNPAAANAFLKTLEEPAPDTSLWLLCQQPARLPATIVSRCQHFRLRPPPLPAGIAWLEAQGIDRVRAELALALNADAPLAALAWLQSEAFELRQRLFKTLEAILGGRRDPVMLAAAWQESPLETLLLHLTAIAADWICLRQGVGDRLRNPDRREWLQTWAQRLDLEQLFAFWQRLVTLRQGVDAPLNQTLQVEALFLEIHRLRP